MPNPKRSLQELAGATQDVYDRNAARFDAERPKGLHERAWIDRFLGHVPAKGSVLDVGCGAGEPIASYMTSRGYRVTGLDACAAMIAMARERMPDGDWRLSDMRSLDLAERFHGIIGWNSFFHLTRDEQREVLPRFAAHLSPAGVLMLTVGPDDGEVEGRVGDDAVYHASLSPAEYGSVLSAAGMTVIDFVAEDPDCNLHTILMARMSGSPTVDRGTRYLIDAAGLPCHAFPHGSFGTRSGARAAASCDATGQPAPADILQ